ncbi:hypothetical protein SBDP1_1210006 [Syntrophobacter sp. SbD1]|nr:hypothetical protein SBDP1_1210006 [Syntrophobacter sp. SbD1]
MAPARPSSLIRSWSELILLEYGIFNPNPDEPEPKSTAEAQRRREKEIQQTNKIRRLS